MFNATFLLIWSLISPHREPDLQVLDLISTHSQIPVDEALKVAAIESSFQTEVVSPKGATGLFQVTPIALLEVQRVGICPSSLNLTWKHVRDVPAHNIFVGTCYLRHLKDLYQGDMEFVLTHYNGGGKAVRLLLEGNPFKETESYLKAYRRLKREINIAQNGGQSNDRE